MDHAQQVPAQPTTLNGIDLTALATAGAALASDPTLAPVTFRASTSWRGAFRTVTEIADYDIGGNTVSRRHRIVTDEPLEILGGDSAPNPQDLILAALGSCMMVGFVAGATQRGIRIESLRIDTACSFDLRGAFGLDPSLPPGATVFHYTIRVSAPGASADALREIHDEVKARSPNRFHLTTPIRMESSLVVE
ncbi:OsmC family protein [Sandaracinus amylolyticus]|uniref:OsmC family protein n=1 Tax=Sandaracinus amylolyticus TaxID=927083 RepID=A0A0F6W9B7_9BACT|nr:OsmC family protein [Sandaracinus amylolyticus]AKF10698.1 hypothetical protein DB32_007847 [Sandaracinus amylolyticus]